MNLHDLSRTILVLVNQPISKVRLARLVYYIHKELIRKKFMQPEDIAYIRSPLGPIPDGFLNLADRSPEIISRPNVSSNLSYNAEDYALDDSESGNLLEQYRDVLKTIEHTLKALRSYTTPDLISRSHHDPSWLAHANGESYFITSADLKDPFPFSTLNPIRIKISFRRPSPNKSGALQANLLRGMISDIVKESTDLEHPDDPATSAPPKKPIRLSIHTLLWPKKSQKGKGSTSSGLNSASKPHTKPEQNPNREGNR